MLKKTHMAAGLLVTLPLIAIDPANALGIFASTFPDVDLKVGIKHRTITHSFLALVITTAAINIFYPRIALAWSINYISHLLLDSCTIMGVPLLFPISKNYFGLKIIKTGSRVEQLILLLIIYILINIFLRF